MTTKASGVPAAGGGTPAASSREAAYRREREKLLGLFAEVTPAKRELVETLIEDAAFLSAENAALRESLQGTGMVKRHPQNPELQKPLEGARQYLKNVATLAVVIKALNGVLSRDVAEGEDDELDEFE